MLPICKICIFDEHFFAEYPQKMQFIQRCEILCFSANEKKVAYATFFRA